jgi:drug/metabolite transporter (DMT)-like permease
MPSKFLTNVWPILCLLFAATMWGIIWYPLRLLEQAGLHGLWVTFVIYLTALLVGLFPAFSRRQEMALHPWLLLLMALANGWCNVSFILAIIDGHVVRVMLLFYLSPLWVTILGWILLGETVSRFSVGILVLAMIGALIMLWDPQLGYPWPQDATDWLAISSGFTFALANVFTRKAQALSVRVKASFAWLGVSTVALVWIGLSGEPVPQISPASLGGALLLGMFGIYLMTLAVFYGVTHMPVHRSAVILLFELVAGAVSAQWLANEMILPREWIGGSLIILAAYLSSRIQLSAGGTENRREI